MMHVVPGSFVPNTTGTWEETLETLKQRQAEAAKRLGNYDPGRSNVCPGCGRCNHCGRGGTPYVPQPYYWYTVAPVDNTWCQTMGAGG